MDYQIRSIGKVCAGNGEPLVPGSVCYSVVVEREGKQQRLDFSEAGWNGPPKDAIGHWRTVVPDEVAKPKALDPDVLMTYFEQLSEDLNPAQEKLRYVLALLLLQKKRLSLEGPVVEADEDCLEFLGSMGEGPYRVRDCRLEPAEIAELQQQLDATVKAA